MRRIVHIASLLFMLQNSFGQGEVNYLYEELPHDSVPTTSIKTHTGLKPEIRRTSGNEGSYLKLEGLADLNYYQKVQGEYKTGLGFNLTSSINDKWYIRLAGVQGLSSFSGISSPKSYLTFKNDSLSSWYTDIRSRISFTPNHIFNFQTGLDHNFVGEGSRSILLGDYGKPYPFAMARARFWRVEYSVLYQFMHEQNGDEIEGKYAASHHLSFNPAKWMNVSIFESVIFQPKDSLLNRGFDVEYLNPFVFYRPQEYSLGSADNVLLGLDVSGRWRSHVFYGQFMFDEFYLSEIRAGSGWWANKYGGQIGAKGRLLNNDLFYRVEYNFVRPYTYAHKTNELNYGNQGTVLAHPYGANFMELVGEVKWQKEKFLAKLFLNYFLTGANNGANQGTDIYASYNFRPDDYGHFIGQGTQINGLNCILTGSYKIHSMGNLHGFVENHFRYNTLDDKIRYQLVVGLRSMLWNDHRNY